MDEPKPTPATAYQSLQADFARSLTVNERHQRRETALVIVVIVALVAALLIALGAGHIAQDARSDVNDLEQIVTQLRQAQATALATARRTDCARVITRERNAVIDTRDNAEARVLQATIQSLLVPANERAANPELVETVRKANADLDHAIAAVQALPEYDAEVDRRCPAVKGAG